MKPHFEFGLAMQFASSHPHHGASFTRPPHTAPVIILAICALALLPATVESQVLLNEYLTLNNSVNFDLDGDYEDWIELYNAGPTAIDMTDYGLSDNPAQPYKWTLPWVVIQPGQQLLIFASGKDRREWVNYWETLIEQGDPWRYRVGDSEPPSAWREIDFDDSGWALGRSGLGYGDGDDLTIVPPTISLYIRKRFTLEFSAPLEDVIETVLLHYDYDDGLVVYLNDHEVHRVNVGIPGMPTPHDQPAYMDFEARMYRGFPPLQFELPDSMVAFLEPGDNVLAVQVHNVSIESDDLSIIPFLTFGLREEPPDPSGVPEVLELRIPHLHTNFQLNHDGETVTLRSDLGQLLDQVDTGEMPLDISRGRQPDGDDDWFYFTQPTPGAPNTTTGWPGLAVTPEFSPGAGFYSGPVTVAMTCPTPNTTIHYTLGGVEPTRAHTAYVAPVTLDTTTVLRARAFADSALPSAIATATFFFDEHPTLPVISLATDPPNFWSEETGIYIMGPNAEPNPPYNGANFWQDWERPIHLEYFDTNMDLGFKLDAGVKIHGGFSRIFSQKSLRILARSRYGTDWIEYPLFAEFGIDRFKRLILRNSGNDWCLTHFRDALMHHMTRESDLDRQAHDAAVVFLNGKYWGIHNIRERQDKFYLETHYGIDPEQVDIIEAYYLIMEGSLLHIYEMINFINTHDLSIEENYEFVQTMMEIDNFAEFFIYEVYLNNRDWPYNNMKRWRPRTDTGRWRWFFFDLDAGLGSSVDYRFNLLAWATDPNGPGGQYPQTTLLIRKLLENDGFRHDFINRYADHLNTTFQPTRMHAQLEQFTQSIQPEIARHFDRWGKPLAQWYEHLDIVAEFIDLRPSFAKNHVMDQFELPGMFNLGLDVDPPGSGAIRLMAIEVDSSFSGDYFRGVPIRLTAAPAIGFAFAGWSDTGLPAEPTVSIMPNEDYAVTALFTPAAGGIAINEINYNSSPLFDPEDWVEFGNSSSYAIDISGWTFKDEDDLHTFVFPSQTVIAAGGYRVLCRDSAAFSALFPNVSGLLGDMNFGLSGGGELVRLYDSGDELVDWVLYDDAPPWPPEPDGNGPTLELIDPNLNHREPGSWAASTTPHGTPGEENSTYVGPTAVASAGAPPAELRLQPARPNPFNPSTTLRCGIAEPGPVRLSIYDTSGRLVRRLLDEPREAGWFDVTWNGRGDSGRGLVSGVYYGRLESAGHVLNRKLLLLK